MMIALCFVILVVAGCPFETLSAPAPMKNALKKRSGSSYKVEGCFSSFKASGDPTAMGQKSSNVECQDTCRDKGYIFAATKGSQCHCGNIFPTGKDIADSECNTRCRSYTACYSPQSCCGGPNAYSVSVVGNIDVAKQILRRLIHKWQTESEYRKELTTFATDANPQRHEADWGTSMDYEGWSKCGKGRYITGMWRSDKVPTDERIGRIDYAECLDAPKYEVPAEKHQSCYDHDVSIKFDTKGWSTCKQGYYMTGL